MKETEARSQIFLWLKEKSRENFGVFSWQDLKDGFSYQGQRITLIGQKGIWKPKEFTLPISIMSAMNSPYKDGDTSDGLFEYKYRGNDPNHGDNILLRELMRTRTPLIYLEQIKSGKYNVVWPVFIINNFTSELSVHVAVDPAYIINSNNIFSDDKYFLENDNSALSIRKYITAQTQVRLHQTAFREIILDAYSRQCTLCRLQHPELLDAAHITPDSDERGVPVVTNGLSLCKIHHAAYDKNIIGISPDYKIKVREDILHEIDGPMLKYGLQSLEGGSLILPLKKKEQPDRDRLSERYRLFISA